MKSGVNVHCVHSLTNVMCYIMSGKGFTQVVSRQ